MISLKLADIFTNLAEVKKAEPSSKESILSLMRAARTLRDDPGMVEDIIEGKEPGELNGIDKYCYGLITEYLNEGSIGEYENFSSSYSEDLVRFIRITGLGRKRIFSIYNALGIKEMDDLRSVFREGNIYDIVRAASLKEDLFNPLFAERIQWSLKYFEGLAGRTPRWPAEFYADIIVNRLKKLCEIKRIDYTGSIRRKKPFIGDIDLLVLPVFNNSVYDEARSLQLLKKIGTLPFVKKLVSIKKTEEDISGSYSTVYDADIEIIIACGNTWAWQLLRTTGSKEHLVLLEEAALKSKWAGLKSLSGRSFNSEEDIYRSLGLKYIPPELREGRDEVMLSSRDMLPRLVETADLNGDLHIHSPWSDGLIDYALMLDSAKKLDYQYIAISDHSQSNYYGNGLDADRLFKKMDFIKDLRKKYKDMEILIGSEIDIREPDLFDYEPDIIRKLDIAIASLHSSFADSIERNTLRAVSALKKDYFDLMAHPTGIVFGNRAPIFIDIDRVIDAAAENGKALEINSYYMRLDLDEENARKAAGAGAWLVINTDSHRPGNMEMIQLGIDVARRAGLESKDILNTMSIDRLREWRRDRKSRNQSL